MNDIVLNPKVISIIRDEFIKMEPHFPDMRCAAQSRGEHPDWPWNGFVLSYATLGGSVNWEERVGPQYDELYGWSVLSRLTLDERRKRLKKIPNPRFAERVSEWILSSYERIAREGGPTAARASYLAQTTAKARIAYVRSYPGFGAKYGRNIPMDCYDELVRDHFALDHRLKTLLSVCGFPSVSYRQGENILRSLASVLNIDAWTLDRLLYSRFEVIKTKIESQL